MKRSIRFLVVAIVLVVSVASLSGTFLGQTAIGQTTKVFLLGGQSNAVGQGSQGDLTGSLAFLRDPQPDVLFYSQDDIFSAGTSTPVIGGTLAPLQPGSFRTDSSGTQFGPEVTFGRTIADAFPDEDFAIIKYARGGTSLGADWRPGTGGDYANFRSIVADGLAALDAAGHTTEIVGMLWFQGERDVVLSDALANAYQANLTAFIADVRNEYGADLPFLIGQLSTNQTSLNAGRLATVRQAQEDVSNAVANTALIDTESFSIRNDDLHFDAAGQIALGEAFAAAAVPFLVPEPTSLATLGIAIFLLTSLGGRSRHGQHVEKQ